MKKIKGRCLCGGVSFEVVNAFDRLFRQEKQPPAAQAGPAFASNLFVTAGGLLWLGGAEDIVNYQVPGRDISKSFCRVCGSGVPWSSADGSKMIIPAGVLSGEPEVSERIRIFAAEQPSWALGFEQVNSHAGFPG